MNVQRTGAGAPEGPAFTLQTRSLFDGERFLEDHCVVVRGGRVVQVQPAAQRPPGANCTALAAGILAPGLIDLQVNGGGGVMLNNAPRRETIEKMSAAHLAFGTTTMLPTLLSDTREVQQAAVDAVREARAAGHRGIAGIHLEGPFFGPARRGAHRAQLVRAPQARDIDWLCKLRDLRVIVTLAPERVEPGDIRRLADSGLLVCAGHSDATYREVRAAADAGLHGVTHLFNAMSPLAAREPGMVGAALDDDTLWLGIIADGHHVHPACIRLACRAKPTGKVVLVSDAMATVGSERPGRAGPGFELYGERIVERGGRLANAAGVLAGSAIGMIDAVRYASCEVGLPLGESLRMASLYPAAVLGLQKTLGRIAPGQRADFVHFDGDFRVRNTWVAGVHRAHG
jgi:N-acetylglucosamine-6-phosphate deacetylase